MNAAAQHTLDILPDIVLGYGHSDEYSFVFHKSCTLFERRSAKIASTVVSTFTSAYVHLWPKFFSSPPEAGKYIEPLYRQPSQGAAQKQTSATPMQGGAGNAEEHVPVTTPTLLDISHLPTFDSRCISYPSDSNLRDYLSWRQADCHINNLYNTTFWALVLRGGMSNTEAEEFLKGTVSSDKNEILWSRFNTNYNNEPEAFKKGSVVTRNYALVDFATDAAAEGSLEETKDNDLSKTQKEKMKKARQRAGVAVQHLDIINDEFWVRRPWLLNGRPGKPIGKGSGQ